MTPKASNFNRQLSNRKTSSYIAPANKEISWLSLDEKLQRFELPLHGGDMMMATPTGQEFGAQSK
jgi:hypothetical protein